MNQSVTSKVRPKIKFNRLCPKLRDGSNSYPIKEARLLQVLPVDISTLSKEFIDYDTDNSKYPLKFDSWYLLLILQKPNGELFTTLRTGESFRASGRIGKGVTSFCTVAEDSKRKYYEKLVGEVFDIVIA